MKQLHNRPSSILKLFYTLVCLLLNGIKAIHNDICEQFCSFSNEYCRHSCFYVIATVVFVVVIDVTGGGVMQMTLL